MIRFIKGILIEHTLRSVVVEVNGIGYEIFIPANSSLYKKKAGEEVRIYTHMVVKEDSISLMGFTSTEERELFEKLITVNSVGVKAGLAILSTLPVREIKEAIVFEDVALLTQAPGVGKKMAQKIILELRDKIESIQREAPQQDAEPISVAAGENRSAKEKALEDLMSLGFSRMEATAAIQSVSGEESLTEQDYLKAALKNLA